LLIFRKEVKIKHLYMKIMVFGVALCPFWMGREHDVPLSVTPPFLMLDWFLFGKN